MSIAWIVLILIFVIVLSSKHKKAKQKSSQNNAQQPRTFRPVFKNVQSETDDIILEVDWTETFLVIEQAVQCQDYEFARTWLQKFSYGTVSNEVPQSVRDNFKRLMTAFCREDPLYRQIMQRAVPIVIAQPGMLQTALYPQLPSHSEEQIRYALYFAHELGDLTRLKKGRSYQLFGPTQTVYSSPTEVIGQVGQVTLTSNIEIKSNPIDERIAALHREATVYKEENWDAAIACLQEASSLMRQISSPYGAERWTRLPVFLQQAGRFDEAMQEFERLLKEVKPRILKEMSGGRYPGDAKMYTHLNYSQIYDKMRMVCKRQKMPEKASEYKDLSERHRLVFDELRRVADLARDAELDAFKQRRDHRRID